jgi:hypothetical protein
VGAVAPRSVFLSQALARPDAPPDGGPSYQLDFVMPGSSPRCAIDRKQMRHKPNLRYTARGLPHREHLV